MDLGPLNIPGCIIESAAVPIAGAYSRSRKSVLESPDLPSTYFQVREYVVCVLGIEKRLQSRAYCTHNVSDADPRAVRGRLRFRRPTVSARCRIT